MTGAQREEAGEVDGGRTNGELRDHSTVSVFVLKILGDLSRLFAL